MDQVEDNNFEGTFSVFYCLDEKQQSKIIFGPPELNLYAFAGATDADIQWAKIPKTKADVDLQWLTQLSSVKFGTQGDVYNPKYNSVVIQVDTGTTDLEIDPMAYTNFLKLAADNGTPCAMESYKLMCTCKEKDCSDFPTLYMEVNSGNGSFPLSLESKYTMRHDGQDYKYRLMVQGGQSNKLGGNTVQWVFGQPLFHKYYTIFDTKDFTIGFIE
jgi:hypothetical protein